MTQACRQHEVGIYGGARLNRLQRIYSDLRGCFSPARCNNCGDNNGANNNGRNRNGALGTKQGSRIHGFPLKHLQFGIIAQAPSRRRRRDSKVDDFDILVGQGVTQELATDSRESCRPVGREKTLLARTA